MRVIKYPDKNMWASILKRPQNNTFDVNAVVETIIDDVKNNGDKAIRKYSERFDGFAPSEMRVAFDEFINAENILSTEVKNAIIIAKSNIERFHLSQVEEVKVIETTIGVNCWRRSIGIQKVGLYIPGGSAPLFSTVLMLAIPANIARCKEISLCTPCNKDGSVDPAILFAAKLCGVSAVYKVGGVQAIAAMAYGSETVAKVYKIFGPGNSYVTAAKQMVSNDVAIDMPAGPSEVAIIADETCIPSFVAADLLAQAEHGAENQCVLISDSEDVVNAVISEINKQLELLPCRNIAEAALRNGFCILVNDLTIEMEVINEYSPEHLIIATNNANELSDMVINAGSVFIGNYSCESAGDYASGTNHTLPTNGYARAYSGVSLDSFVKKITFQEISEQGIRKLGPTIEVMAATEGLEAHKNAVTIRLKKGITNV